MELKHFIYLTDKESTGSDFKHHLKLHENEQRTVLFQLKEIHTAGI